MTSPHWTDHDLWQKAVSFAARAHRHELRKDHATPYFAHPVRVTLTLMAVFGCTDEQAIAAALLHDTIEDTGVDHDELAAHFGRTVADLVAALSKDARLPEPEREDAYDAQLAEADPRARLIKLADVYDNLCDLAPGSEGITRVLDRAKRAIALVENAGDDTAEHRRALRAVRELLASR